METLGFGRALREREDRIDADSWPDEKETETISIGFEIRGAREGEAAGELLAMVRETIVGADLAGGEVRCAEYLGREVV